MRVDDLLDAIGARLLKLPDVNVVAVPGLPVSPPAVIVHYPTTYTFDAAYARGADSLAVPVLAVVSKADPRAALVSISDFTEGAGSRSVKAVLEASPLTLGTQGVTLAVREVTIADETIAGTTYLVAEFMVELTGKGLE